MAFNIKLCSITHDLMKILKFLILALVFLSFLNDKSSYAQVPKENPTQNSGSYLRQEQELENRKNLPTQIPKSLIEKKIMLNEK